MINAQAKPRAQSRNILLIGVKTGKCDFCKTTKRVLLLRYGFTLCEECFEICTCILQELQESTKKQEIKVELASRKQKTTLFPTAGSKRSPRAPKLRRLESKNSGA